ncbi:MAG TPA: PIN domain-containing protein [Gemmatimonadaceae bacterium]
MRYLIDTTVLSELVKPRPDDRVKKWIDAQQPLDLGISVLSLGEVQQGIARLPAGEMLAALNESRASGVRFVRERPARSRPKK